MTRKEYDDRRSALSKEIREAMRKQQVAADSGDRAGDLDAQGEISDLMAQVDELDRKFRLN
jgi:ribonucleotide reductase alpha subunit